MTHPDTTLPVAEASAPWRPKTWTRIALVLLVLAAPVPFVHRPHFPMIGIGGAVLFNFGMLAIVPLIILGEKALLAVALVVYAIFWFLPPAAALAASYVAWRRASEFARDLRRAAMTLLIASLFLVAYVTFGYIWYQPLWR